MSKPKNQGGREYRSQDASLKWGDAVIEHALMVRRAANESTGLEGYLRKSDADAGIRWAADRANKQSVRRLTTSQKYR